MQPKNVSLDTQINGALDGDINTARARLITMTEIAVRELNAASLNALSVTVSAHLAANLGAAGQTMFEQIKMDLASERTRDWTLTFSSGQWRKA